MKYELRWEGKELMLQELEKLKSLKNTEDYNYCGSKSENILIKGENLKALNYLQRDYSCKIKTIYIDPPYNTGKDFIYKDKFKKNGDKEKHSSWLNFMYPRLSLARNLLKDDGVIFISIDDNEQANLKLLCDEIFGEENFVADFIWNNKYTTSNDIDVSYQHEHILCYSKDRKIFKLELLPRTEKQNKDYKNRDNDPKGAWKPTPLHARSGNANSVYEIVFPNGIHWACPQGRFPRYSKDKLLLLYQNNELYFNSNGGIDKKTYLSEVRAGITCGTVWNYNDVGHTHGNNEEIAEILDKGVFNDPKGVKLLKHILKISTKSDSKILGEKCGLQGKERGSYLEGNDRNDFSPLPHLSLKDESPNLEPDIILDFFAGSGTTAQAVMELNAEDNGNRKFILVQLPEPISEKSKSAYDFVKNTLGKEEPKISDITQERIIRASKQIKEKYPDFRGDLGFQVWEEK